MNSDNLNRRRFLTGVAAASALGASAGRAAITAAGEVSAEKRNVPPLLNAKELAHGGRPLKFFTCDLNFVIPPGGDKRTMHVSLPQDWAFLDPQEYVAWHRDFGVNIMFCHAFTWGGYALYPTKLGPVAPGPGQNLFPEVYRLSRKAGLPVCSYFCLAIDVIMCNLRTEWLVPTSRNYIQWGMLAPESPWTDLLCARITEFLKKYPVEWINFDSFNYGKYFGDDFIVQPSPFVKAPFKEIVGRDMPEDSAKITYEESLKYKREIMARWFYRIREAMHKGNPGTKANFNIPLGKPEEPMWVNHPMLNESDQLVAESTDEVASWLLKIRKPGQRVMTTIVGRPDHDGLCDPNSWRKWYEAGCDFFGYAHAIPPDFRPHVSSAREVAIARQAYAEMP
jgi:hypothetical protein